MSGICTTGVGHCSCVSEECRRHPQPGGIFAFDPAKREREEIPGNPYD
jgi:hypothetical protein